MVLERFSFISDAQTLAVEPRSELCRPTPRHIARCCDGQLRHPHWSRETRTPCFARGSHQINLQLTVVCLMPPFLRFSQRPTRYFPVLDHLQTSIAELHPSPERTIRFLQTLLVLRSSRHQRTVRPGEIGSTGVTATRIAPAQLLVSFTLTVCGISEQQMARPTTIRLA